MTGLDDLLAEYQPPPRQCCVCDSPPEVKALIEEFARRYDSGDPALAGWSITGDKATSRSLFRICRDRFSVTWSKHRLSSHLKECLGGS